MDSSFQLVTSDGQNFEFRRKWLIKSKALQQICAEGACDDQQPVPLTNIDAETLQPILQWLELNEDFDSSPTATYIRMRQNIPEKETALFDSQSRDNMRKMVDAARILQISDLTRALATYITVDDRIAARTGLNTMGS